MNNSNEERPWLERMQQIPKYSPVLDKLVLGASPEAVTDWLMQQTDRGPFSGLSRPNVFLHLIGLKGQLEENSRKSPKKESAEQSQRLPQVADEFTSGTTPKAEPGAKHPEPIDEVTKTTETQCPRCAIETLTSDGLLRWTAIANMKHIDRLGKSETQLMMPYSQFERAIETQIKIAEILRKNESRHERFARQSKTDIPVSGPLASETTQRVAKLTESERQHSLEADEYAKNSIDRKTHDAKVN